MGNQFHKIVFSDKDIALLKDTLETNEGVAIVCHKEFSGIWLHDEAFEVELRLLLLANVRMTISRVQFIHRRQGIMTKIYDLLEQYCKTHGIQEMVVQSVQTPEMARWCEKMGFHPVPSTCLDLGGFVAGDYLKKLDEGIRND